MTGTPSAAMQTLLDRLAVEDAGLTDPTLLDPEQGRVLSALVNMRWNMELPPVKEARTILHASMPARYLVPENDAGTDAIIHVHGGGWAFCSPATHEAMARRLAASCAAPVLSVSYRLAPEFPWPAGLCDVVEAFAACAPQRRWSIAGDSAGANLALAATLRLQAGGSPPPACALLFYGVWDADFSSPSYVANADGPGLTRDKMRRYWDWYVPPEDRGRADVAPLQASDEALAALPPLYVNAAGLDPLRSESERLVERLHALGRDDAFDLFEGVVHGFMQMGSVLPEAQTAFERAGAFFRAQAAAAKSKTQQELEERP